jgi:hypothetical protein
MPSLAACDNLGMRIPLFPLFTSSIAELSGVLPSLLMATWEKAAVDRSSNNNADKVLMGKSFSGLY